FSVDAPDSENEASGRPSLDDSNARHSLKRMSSRLSISSDAADGRLTSQSSKRASLQPYYQPSPRQQHTLHLRDYEQPLTSPVTPKRMTRPATIYIPKSGYSAVRRGPDSLSRQERLAQLLSQDEDMGESPPHSPIATPAKPAPHLEEDEASRQAQLSSATSKKAGQLAAHESLGLTFKATERQATQNAAIKLATNDTIHEVTEDEASGDVHKLAVAVKSAAFDQASLEHGDRSKAEAHDQETGDSAAVAMPTAQDGPAQPTVDPGTAVDAGIPAADKEETVVCRLCERTFYRSDLNMHSDMCVLEQTRAMKLDEANHRIRRLRDSATKRLNDLKKVRRWDKVAIREAERVIRIAERAIVWPDGDNHHDLIVAKAKFAKYTEKLERITGTGSALPSARTPIIGFTADALVTPTSANGLPRADVETIWLAKQLLSRIQEKSMVIEEFDKEFNRLERQAALTREAENAESADHLLPPPAKQPDGPFLPTWSQLSQFNDRSPSASARTSVELSHSHTQSESGSATPDLGASHMLESGHAKVNRGDSSIGRRHSKPSRAGRRSFSRSFRGAVDFGDADVQNSGSGSRKLVSLFAALFRGHHGGFGRNREAAGPAALRRRNSPAHQPTTKASSVFRLLSQNAAAVGQHSAPPASAQTHSATAQQGQGKAGSPGDLTINTSASSPTAATANDSTLLSPVGRQRKNSQPSSVRATPDSISKAQRMPSIDDFDFVKPISRGAFGRVYLARKKATKDLYAIKVMRKKDMINKNMVTQALAERRALSLLSTEWVVQLYYAFHSSKHLFLVMEYLIGGDLAGLLRVWGPDNVILASDGHIKLSDFGLSQVAVRGNASSKGMLDGSDSNANEDSPTVDELAHAPAAGSGDPRTGDKNDDYWTAELSRPGRSVQASVPASNALPTGKALPVSKRAHARKSSRGFLGTPDYLAPELLLGAGNGLAVDWWALGVCLFEFLCGYPPFTDESPEAIFRNILNHAIDWPDEEGYVSEEAAELVNALLRPDPATRAHWKEIQSARLFSDWDLTSIRQMEPPFVPMPDDDVDTSYFEPCQRTEIQRLSNATFLQAEAPKRVNPLSPPSRATDITESLMMADPDTSSADGANVSTSVGQLKKLFTTLSVEGDSCADADKVESVEPAMDADMQDGGPNKERRESIASLSSSDNYSFKNDGRSSGRLSPEADGSSTESSRINKRQSTLATKATPAAAASERPGSGSRSPSQLPADSAAKHSRASSAHNSVNSLSESDFESLSRHNESVSTESGEGGASPSQEAAPFALPPLPVNHLKLVASRSSSQHSDGVHDPVLSNISSKTHSRCASANITMLGGKKVAAGTKSRRPSHSQLENISDSDLTAPLLRASSTDERLQHSASGSDSAVDSNSGGDAGSVDAKSANEGEADADDMQDDETERVFDDFTYKNLALLSNINKGVSSTGHTTPQFDRNALAPATSSSTPAPVTVGSPNYRAPSSYSSLTGISRGSPINAYDIKAPNTPGSEEHQ
ncbi:hypothetical protein GGI12_004082, partial [Dipsacomyces acuminosporus]